MIVRFVPSVSVWYNRPQLLEARCRALTPSRTFCFGPERMLPPKHSQFESLAQDALATWCPDGNFQLREMGAGKSGAAVLDLDIRSSKEQSLTTGHYVLKLAEQPQWPDQDDEATAHDRARHKSAAFADAHIPPLHNVFPKDNLVALLYEVAGKSLRGFTTTDFPDCPGFLEASPLLIKDILDNWSDPAPTKNLTPAELLHDWLGYRLDVDAQPRLLQRAFDLFEGNPTKIIAAEVILNPIAFFEYARKANWPALSITTGLQHGDLHGGNFLIQRSHSPHNYWLIDFALSQDSRPFGFDLAYLEVAHILTNLADVSPLRLITLLRQLQHPEYRQYVPPGRELWLMECLRTMRRVAEEWMTDRKRVDELTEQFAIARVAAGLNWANKRFDPAEDPYASNKWQLALAYAGWSALEYVRDFHHKHIDAICEHDSAAAASTGTLTTPRVEDRQLWSHFVQSAAGLSAESSSSGTPRYVLIADALDDDERVQALGNISWSAVIDLDLYSDVSGLFTRSAHVLETRRKVHRFQVPHHDIQLSGALYRRGTAWMMAAGWHNKGDVLSTPENWRYDKLPLVRDLFTHFFRAISPDPIYAIVLPTSHNDEANERITRVVSALDEASRGQASIFIAGEHDIIEGLKYEDIPLSVDIFLTLLAETFGVSANADVPQLPGRHGPCDIPIDVLRAVQENLAVLHSAILTDIADVESHSDDSFWRGSPPTWNDLHSAIDVERPVTTSIVCELRKWLEKPRSRTVVLSHKPGAGATTVSRRVAWELRDDYPVVLLHTYSADLASRIDSLYNRTERPILLIAESDVLVESRREDLYRALSRRQAPVVLLYLRRVFDEDAEGLLLDDELCDTEADAFLLEYVDRTDDGYRKRELRRLTHDPSLRRYRSPFFYGLVTYERDFHGTEQYVAHHLADVRGAVPDVLEYLALVTIYTNAGIHDVIVRRLLDSSISPTSRLTIHEMLGVKPARLLIERNGQHRLLHQIIAEDVLQHIRGDGVDWRYRLKAIAEGFIDAIHQLDGERSEPLMELLRHLFIDRAGRGVDDTVDRGQFAPLIEDVDDIDRSFGHEILKKLTDRFPNDPHFWNHLGRHHIYRMKRDFEKAEEYLEKAVALAPDDSVHRHTLGFVRRARVNSILRSSRSDSVHRLLQEIEPHFSAAASDFEQSRELKQDNLHGYITHIQMILRVVKRLRQLTHIDALSDLAEPYREWVQEQLAVAQGLLQQASELRGTLNRPNYFVTQCRSDLHHLYGDVDLTIRLWEVQLSRTPTSRACRRALAFAYVDRREGRLDTLCGAELERVRDLMEGNIRTGRPVDDDYRLWFESSRLLSDFDIDDALSTLRIWADNTSAWRAPYYMYILHFLLWASKRTDSLAEHERAREKCSRLYYGRPGTSHMWLASQPDSCPIVGADQLGRFSREKGFFERSDVLRRVNATIDEIKGPQAGFVSILNPGQQTTARAFFVPGREFTEDDLNQPVNVYIGFGAAGLRAWSPVRGWIEGGDLRGTRHTPSIAPASTTKEGQPTSGEVVRKRAKELEVEQILSFASDLVSARMAVQADITVDELESRVDAAFGIDKVFTVRGGEQLQEALEKTGRFKFVERGQEVFVWLHKSRADAVGRQGPNARRIGWVDVLRVDGNFGFVFDSHGDRYYFRANQVSQQSGAYLKEGCFVVFQPESNEQGLLAVGVEVLDKTRLWKAIVEVINTAIEQASAAAETVALADVHQVVYEEFGGKERVLAALGDGSIRTRLRRDGRFEVHGTFPDETLQRKDDEAFGRVLRSPE